MPEIVKRLCLAQRENELVVINGNECIITNIQAHRGFFPYTNHQFVIEFYDTNSRSKTSIETGDLSFLEFIFNFKKE